jgi:hypothetical protein
MFGVTIVLSLGNSSPMWERKGLGGFRDTIRGGLCEVVVFMVLFASHSTPIGGTKVQGWSILDHGILKQGIAISVTQDTLTHWG